MAEFKLAAGGNFKATLNLVYQWRKQNIAQAGSRRGKYCARSFIFAI